MKKNYILRKTHEVDKDRFAELLMVAKGGRTMKDFAEACGVNPSTFTRIAQKANKGASSTELIEAIAKNADPNSGVTLENLASANGYTVERDDGLKIKKLEAYYDNSDTLIRNVLVQALLDRGAEVRMGNIRYEVSKSLALRPDALIMTDAFGNSDEVWFVNAILAVPRIAKAGSENGIINASKVKQTAFDKISRFVFISMNRIELFRPSRFSLVMFDREMYDIIVEEFAETNVPTDISVILVDPLNNCIADEFMLPHFEKGSQAAYFKTTSVIVDDRDYLRTEDYDDDDE